MLSGEASVSNRNRTHIGHDLTKRRKSAVATSPKSPSTLTAQMSETFAKLAADEGWGADEIDAMASSFRSTALAKTDSYSKRATSHEVYRNTKDVSFPDEFMASSEEVEKMGRPRRSRSMSTIVRKHRQDMTSWAVVVLAIVGVVLAAIPEKYAARTTRSPPPVPAPVADQSQSSPPRQGFVAKLLNKNPDRAAPLAPATYFGHESFGPLAFVLQRFPWSAANRKAAQAAVASALEQESLQAEELKALRASKTEDQCQAAWEWMSMLGSPATLVGGAALASFFELRDQLAPSEDDSRPIRFGKNIVLLLLLGSFACEICCVYINTIAGDQLMANNDAPAPAPYGMLDGTGTGKWGRGTGRINCEAASPMMMMHREMEFEYLASRVGFFQGILMWIGALCAELFVSSEMIDPNTADKAQIERRKVLKASAAATSALLLWMVSFFNWHLPFYKNYFQMISRLGEITWMRYVWHSGPPRVMAILVLFPLAAFIKYTFSAFLIL